MGKNKKARSFQAMAPTLPLLRREMDEDVLAEILKRLPMESVGRFRCVCKWWNSIISSAFFIKLHFTFNFSATPGNLKPYLHVARSYYNHFHPSHKRYALRRPLDDHQEQLHLPIRAEEVIIDRKMFIFVDVIHGVVCIVYSWAPSFHWTFLWNPSIHKYVALPRLKLVAGYFFDALGFGYDASKDDFKVVMISSGNHLNGMLLHFEVYSTRQGFWRPPLVGTADEIKDIRGWVFEAEGRNGCFVNGTIHWLLAKTLDDDDFVDDFVDDYSILMFDCESEEARRMDIPEQVSCSEIELALFEYAGMLAILVDTSPWPGMNLWVMEEYGVSTSWKKLYTVNPVYPDLNLEGDEDLDYEDPDPCEVIINDPSFEIEKLVPYGPSNQWRERHQILCNHVFNKSLFLMDHPKAQSYTNQDIVPILILTRKRKRIFRPKKRKKGFRPYFNLRL